MINMSEADRKRVDTIVKMFSYFGPSARNTGLPDQGTILTFGSEVGPYLPAIYPQMVEYFSKIFNKLYARGKKRLASDLKIDERWIPDFKVPPNIAMPG